MFKNTEQVREARARRKAKQLGYRLMKSRTKNIHMNNFGDWRIVCDETNFIVRGFLFDWSLSDVEAFLDEVA
ncbi:MAG: hypothetical protein FWD90_13960 [Defluviitaleaceae bacterium]|nr:hypothetical protein [Defluviitaleaceae bacterium]